LHGANRLASNSLLEGLVYGAHAGEGASRAASEIADDFRAPPLENGAVADPGVPLDLADIRNSLKSLTWRAAGVQREAGRLAEAAENIDRWCSYVLPRQFHKPDGWELQNLLVVARLIVGAALRREESRGVHLRTDFPQRDDAHWNHRIGFRREKSGACAAV
jgi:L-aspartate oxidase